MNFLEKRAFSRRLAHWMNGNDGKVIPFGTKTTANLVETSFLCQGLLTVREYFKDGNTTEKH
jgi:hypothetical protein